jgi:hypothetical protein
VNFAGFECKAFRTAYRKGGATAIYLDDAETGEPVATATVNMPGVLDALGSDMALIKDYAENEGILKALVDAGIVEDTGRTVPVGYATARVVRIVETAG